MAAEKIRLLVLKLKDKLPQFMFNNAARQSKLAQYKIYVPAVPAAKVGEIAEKLKYETVTNKVREIVARYEKFTGVEEVMAIQNTVIDAQERFMAAQERRRDVGRQLANLEARVKELHFEMQNTMKGDDKYLILCTEEHKLIVQERALRALFADAEREERELFATMSAAVKLGHERERAHAERNKYWYIIASIFGTVLGIAGSTINNHLKMSEFREMMEQQMARSASVLYTIAGGAAAGTTDRVDIAQAMKTEFEYQDQLAESLKVMQKNIDELADKQTSLIEHLHQREHSMDVHLRELKLSILKASQSSAKSDAEIAKALSVVHQDLEDADHNQVDVTKKVMLEPNQIVTGIGFIMCMAVILSSIIGRMS